MERARSDGPAWVPELELPDALREKCARMQAEARYSVDQYDVVLI